MQKETAMRIKKNIAVFLHLIFLTLAVTGISLMYLNMHYGKGFSMIHETKYEDSGEFSEQLQGDIDNVFNYVAYRDILTTNGEYDMSLEIVEVRYPSGQDVAYTIDELVRHARSLGYYLDENFKIVQDALKFNPRTPQEVYVIRRAYGLDQGYAEPGDGYTTLDDVALEVMECISAYFTAQRQFFEQPTNLYFQISYEEMNGERTIFSNNPDLSADEMKAMGRYFILRGDSIIADSNMPELPKNISTYTEVFNPYDSNIYYMGLCVDTSYREPDAYAEAAAVYHQLRVHYLEGLCYLISGLIGIAITLYYLVVVSGYRTPDRKTPYLHGFDMVTTESCILLTVTAVFFALFLSEKVGYKLIHLLFSHPNWEFAERMMNSVVIYICCLVSAFSLLRRYKSRQLWLNSTLYKIIRGIHHFVTYQGRKKLLTVSYFMFVLIHLALFGLILLLFQYRGQTFGKAGIGALAAALVIFDFRCFYLLFKKAVQQDGIIEAIDIMASGDTTYYVDPDNFTDKENLIAQRINSISVGLEAALQEKVKSERLKADLITNVSHDIKTPLTSIINYVDLIKREHIEDPKIQGYLDVLEQKAYRLKNLTEDLVEASKASSGNLKLEIADIDIVELVHQTNGEFEEKFAARNLELVAALPGDSMIIEADGRSLWRVLENLYNNAAKYAMEHSRVYVDVAREADQVCFTIKNISRYPLNIRGDELTERFVRGDVSRNTEGSGLGLSIAQSLTSLQKGMMKILIDGDLFKVQLHFPLKESIE